MKEWLTIKTGAMYLGISGGVAGLIFGLALFLLRQLGIILIVEGSEIVQVLSLVIPVSGLVGGAIVKGKTLIAAILMGVSGILIFVFLQGVHVFSLLSGAPLIIGGILALISTNKDTTSKVLDILVVGRSIFVKVFIVGALILVTYFLYFIVDTLSLPLLAWPILNGVCFLIFIRDMKARNEDRLFWLVKFLFLGPLALAWYKSYRNPKHGEYGGGDKFYQLAMNFILPWSIYVFTAPVLVLGLLTMVDLFFGAITMAGLIFWFGLLYREYLVFAVPVWTVSLVILAIIILVRRPRMLLKESPSPK